MRVGIVVAASLAAFPALAQFQYDLATTHDGSVLYFSYVDASVPANSRIYRWSPDSGVTLFGDRPDLAQLPPHYGEHLYGTQLTDAGSVLYHAEPLCVTGFGPGFNDCTVGETEIVIPNMAPFSIQGFLLVSPNGRYGVFTPYGSGALWVDWFTGEQIEVDFHQYEMIPNVSPPFYVNQHAVANNGSFLITASGIDGLKVWSKNGETVLPVSDIARNAAISADGSTVAVTARDLNSPNDPTIPTYIYDLASGRMTKFAQPVSMSDDGQTVAYPSADILSLADAQAIVARSDGTGAHQITNTPVGLRSVLLSGDAHYLYVVVANPYFSSSRIQRYDLTTGAVEDIPAVP